MALGPKMSTKAFEVNGNIKMGHFQFGVRNNTHGTSDQEIHDGDTVGLNTTLNFSSRFLGIDAPEISFTIRTDVPFVPIEDPKWVTFWTSGEWKNMPLKPALLNHLVARIGDGSQVAANHKQLADVARNELKAMIDADMQASGTDKDSFWFFLAFGSDFFDSYGRTLCYLNAERSIFTPPATANKLSYNERLLQSGAVTPYFIYPNTEPFLSSQPFDAANLKPTGFWKMIASSQKLQAARASVAAARTAAIGIFAPANALILLPYEIRFIARKDSFGPDRFVIDLSKNGSNKIIKPERYFSIKNVEDRLFVSKEHVPLFLINGWAIV